MDSLSKYAADEEPFKLMDAFLDGFAEKGVVPLIVCLRECVRGVRGACRVIFAFDLSFGFGLVCVPAIAALSCGAAACLWSCSRNIIESSKVQIACLASAGPGRTHELHTH